MGNFRGGFGGGGFGGANMQNLMRQAQKMQEDMQKAKEELEQSEFTASVGGGAVTVVVYGTKKIKSIDIKPEVIDPEDKEMLEDLICAGINDAISQVEKIEEENTPSVPGLF